MNLKGYRAGANITQDEAAKHINTCRETYRKKETRGNFSLEQAVSLSKLFGITLEEFYEATKS